MDADTKKPAVSFFFALFANVAGCGEVWPAWVAFRNVGNERGKQWNGNLMGLGHYWL
jgi:hypothetical protein